MPVTTQSLIYPTSLELSEIDQDLLPVLEATANPIFKEFPIKPEDAAQVAWEQEDSIYGLMQARGIEGQYPVAPTLGIRRYSLRPSRMGEKAIITGEEIETRRGFGQVNAPINVKDLVMRRQESTGTRMFNQMAYLLWTMLSTGYYSVLDPLTNAIENIDSVITQYFSANVPWSTIATATPLANFRAVQLLHRGFSVTFDKRATAWMNLKTFNSMIANTNANDLGGRRSTGLETVEGLDAYNDFIAMKDNLPRIAVYDEGYRTRANDPTSFVPFIPDNTSIVIGKRLNGAPVGDFCLTRNADNGNSSQPLFKVVNHGLLENQAPPVQIEVYRGWNGGPRLRYGNAVVIMTGL